MPEFDIKATLGKKYGPLTGTQWLLIGGAAGVAYYLWSRSRPVTEEAVGEGSPTSSTDPSLPYYGGYGEGYGGIYTAPMPSYPTQDVYTGEQTGVSVPIEFTSEPLEPMFADCGEGYLLDIFGRCVPDPSLIPIPTPSGPSGGGGNAQKKIARINDRIAALREGGVTKKERPKVKRLRARRQAIRRRPRRR